LFGNQYLVSSDSNAGNWERSERLLIFLNAIAKAWIVTEVIVLLKERQKAAFPLYLNWYREHLPDWLDDVVKML